MTFVQHSRSVFLLCIALVGIFSAALHAAPLPEGWTLHKGKTLTIGVPPGFSVDEISASEVDLINEEEQIKFSVFVPTKGAQPKMMEVEVGEKLTEKDSSTKGDTEETQMTMKGKNYIRFVVSLVNSAKDTNVCWGIRVPNMDDYKNTRPTYVKWKQTLTVLN